jgi:hypothetical protein
MTTNDQAQSPLAPDEVYIYTGPDRSGIVGGTTPGSDPDPFQEQVKRGKSPDGGLAKVTLSDDELDRLRAQVQRITSKLEATGHGADAERFAVDEVTVHVGISASGHFFFVASAGIEAAVDVTWRRQHSHAPDVVG